MSRTLKLNPLLLGMLFFFLTFSSYISMLPVAGVSGTLSDVSFFLLSLLLRMRDQRCSPATALTPLQRFVNTSAQGIVHAKTGRAFMNCASVFAQLFLKQYRFSCNARHYDRRQQLVGCASARLGVCCRCRSSHQLQATCFTTRFLPPYFP